MIAATVASAALAGRTCAYAPSGRQIGCVVYVGDCNLSPTGSRQRGLVYMWEGFIPPPDASARRVRPGVWRIRDVVDARYLGYAAAADTAHRQWRVTTMRGRLVATVRGPLGPEAAMILLNWGGDCFE